MRNWKIAPQDPTVARFIDCYWFLEKTEDDIGPDYPKLNPDPAGHIILADSAQSYQYQSESFKAQGVGCHLIYPHSKTLVMDHSQPFLVVGIKFHVGTLYSLRSPHSELAIDPVIDKIIDSKAVLSFDSEQIVTDMSRSPEEHRDHFDSLLKPFLRNPYEDKHSDLVRKVIPIFLGTPLSDLGIELGFSQRTIERSFVRVTGFTLKQYDAMLRLERLLDHVHRLDSSELEWADIALQFGFSDQSHLVRYLKGAIGSTPGRYAKYRDLAIDAYGDFE